MTSLNAEESPGSILIFKADHGWIQLSEMMDPKLLHPLKPRRTGAPIKTLEKANSYQSPWLALVVTCGVAFWIWDSKTYPLPEVVDPSADDPFSKDKNLLQKSATALREAKEDRFWQSLDLTTSAWKATHQGNGITSMIRFSESRIYVEPAEVVVGIPFVHDSEYEILDDQIIQAVIPVPDGNGGATAERKRASFEGYESDGRVYLQTTADDDFTLERIK